MSARINKNGRPERAARIEYFPRELPLCPLVGRCGERYGAHLEGAARLAERLVPLLTGEPRRTKQPNPRDLRRQVPGGVSEEI